jgi:hypothetical protein
LPEIRAEFSFRSNRRSWLGGSCAGTFGSGDNTLFTVLNGTRFYDIDCFAYDSTKTPILKNAAFLRQRLLTLKADGYDEVFFVTHSLGGILTLQMFTDILLTSDGTVGNYQAWWTPEPMKVVGINAWAAPINGLHNPIRTGGPAAAVLLGLDPQVLKDISPGSAYLAALKQNLTKLDSQFPTLSSTWKGRINFPVDFFQGQGADYVVERIDTDKAKAEGWFGHNLTRQAIDTNVGHTNNVHDSGTAEMFGWPAKMTEDEALLAIDVSPRFDEVFVVRNSIPSSLEARQLKIVNGIIFYAQHAKLLAEANSAIQFIKDVFQESYFHDQQVDATLVSGLLNQITVWSQNTNDDVITFFVNFFSQVLDGYNPVGGANTEKLGNQNSKVVDEVLTMTEDIALSVKNYIDQRPDKKSLLIGHYNDAEDFYTHVLTVVAKYLGSDNGPVVANALQGIQQLTAIAPDKAVIDSEIVSKMTAYYAKNTKALNAENKETIGDFYANVASRNANARAEVLQALTTTSTGNAPLWVSLRSDDVITKLSDTIPVKNATDLDFQFLAEIAARSGASGNNEYLATHAAHKAVNIFQLSGSNSLDQRNVLQNAAQKATTPTVTRIFNNAIQ